MNVLTLLDLLFVVTILIFVRATILKSLGYLKQLHYFQLFAKMQMHFKLLLLLQDHWFDSKIPEANSKILVVALTMKLLILLLLQ